MIKAGRVGRGSFLAVLTCLAKDLTSTDDSGFLDGPLTPIHVLPDPHPPIIYVLPPHPPPSCRSTLHPSPASPVQGLAVRPSPVSSSAVISSGPSGFINSRQAALEKNPLHPLTPSPPPDAPVLFCGKWWLECTEPVLALGARACETLGEEVPPRSDRGGSDGEEKENTLGFKSTQSILGN
ncbi:hypothetical protein AAFF_G00327630 [Aldrovandia affinis]|uniref:Uncharacterized protein n=1 Tax=Aldrovandia affinis TaxID=143900 RepID=A0AAD7T9I1_9TELE|nr:hypothetical protein AAFF_G00327630 [Aldrovandia affinis]